MVAKCIALISTKNNGGMTPLHLASSQGHTEVVRVLASRLSSDGKLADINACDSVGDTAVNMAALNGHVSVMKLLVSQFGCSPTVKGFKGRTPLIQACNGGHLEAIKLLITEFNCDVMAADDDGCLAIHVATIAGKEKVVKELVTTYKCPVDSVEFTGETSLHIAVRHGHTGLLRVLLSELGANIEARNWKGNDTPLNVAALVGQVEAVRVLVSEFGCSLQTKGFNGRMPLHQACDSGHVHLVNMLVSECNCSVTTQDDFGNTPLHVAAISAKGEVVKVLITEHGSDVDSKNFQNRTPLHLACQGGHLELAEKLVVEYGADAMIKDNGGLTAVHIAAINGRVDLMRKLASLCTDALKATTLAGHTPLHGACQKGETAIVKMLISEFKCDPLSCDSTGNMAVHHAAFGGHKDAVKLLVSEYKCPLDCVNFNLCTPLHLACQQGHTDVVNVLVQEMGADPQLQDIAGRSAVDIAVQNGHLNLVNILNSKPKSSDPKSTKTSEKPSENTASSVQNSKLAALDDASSLHEACRIGDLEKVQVILENSGFDVMKLDGSSNTPLHIAADNGHLNIAGKLIEFYDTNSGGKNCKGETPLHLACRSGHTQLAQLLASKFSADVEAKDSNGDTSLHLACLFGHQGTVDLLCQQFGCNASSKGYAERSCLHHACAGGHTSLAEKLVLEYKCDPNACDEDKNMPLHCAAHYGHSDVFFLLINKLNCPLGSRGIAKSTVLHQAAAGGHLDLVRTLISQYGFDPLEPDERGCIALHTAAWHAFSPPAEKTSNTAHDALASQGFFHFTGDLNHVEVIRALVNEFKCPLDSANLDGQTPFQLAMLYSKHPPVIDLFVKEFKCTIEQERSFLHMVSAVGGADLVGRLISQGGQDPLSRDHQGATPLHIAALHGNIDVARKLITDFGTPSEVRSSGGHTPLHCAAQNGHTGLIRMLITEFNCDPMSCDDCGGTPLHQAATAGQAGASEVLVKEFNCPVDSVNMALQTPLHVACQAGFIVLVKVLVHKLGADSTLQDFTGKTPLDIAFESGHPEIVKAITVASEFSKTDNASSNVSREQNSLHKACERGHWEEIEKLISGKQGGPVDVDAEGHTPLHIAARAGHSSVVDKLITIFNCDPMARNKKGDAPLHLAVAHKQATVVHLLLTKFNCSPTLPGYKGQLPLHFASMCGDLSIARKLVLEYKVDPMVPDEEGNTPLHTAAFNGRTEIVMMLLRECKCSPQAKNKDSKTPLDIARERGHQSCIDELSQCDSQLPGSKILPRVLVMGSTGAGKSTLITTLTHNAGSSQFSSKASLPGRQGTVQLRYLDCNTSNMAVIELPGNTSILAPIIKMLLKPTSGVVLLVVDLKKDRREIVAELSIWLCLVSYSDPGLEVPLRVIVIGSHADDTLPSQGMLPGEYLDELFAEVSQLYPNQLQKLEILGCFASNCCLPDSPKIQEAKAKLREAIQSFNNENSVPISKEAWLLLQSLAGEFHGRTIVSVSEVLDHCAKKELYPDIQVEQILTHLRELDEYSLLLFVATGEKPNTQWIILNASSIAVSLHENFQFTDRSVVQNVGIISEQNLVSLFPGTAPEPLIQCLRHLLYCREVKSPGSVFHALGIDASQLSESSQATAAKGSGGMYFLFPSLIQASKMNRSWKSLQYKPFSKGFHIGTLSRHQSFPPQFVSGILLEVATKMAFLVPKAHKRGSCELWKDGIQWVAISGVEVVVEVVGEGRGVVVMVRGSEVGCNRVLSAVMTKVLETKEKFCNSLPIKLSFVHPDDFVQGHIPEFGELHLFGVEGVQNALQLQGLTDQDEKMVVPYSKLAGLCFWGE